MIKIAQPNIGKEEIKGALDVLKSGNLIQGKKVKEFEKKFAAFCGTQYALATSTGTSALHLALLALGIKAGDEVITSPFTFIATSNAILYTGAIPVFVDIDPDTFNIDPSYMEKAITSKTRAILPVHLFGLPAELGEINKIAKKHNLYVIEDACQAHGAELKINGIWKKVGSIGDIGCFSFYPTKNMTTSEGGMITTNNKIVEETVKSLRNHGMTERYKYKMLGFNYRMTEIQAAIGIEQLKKLNNFNKQRRKNAKILSSKLVAIKKPNQPENAKHVFQQFTIRVQAKSRSFLQKKLLENGIISNIYYPKIITQYPFYKKYHTKYLTHAMNASKEVLSIPVHPALKKEDLEKIVKITNKFTKREIK